VPLYVLGYSCLKGCIYGLLFWLPIFFDNKGGDLQSQKGYISSMIDIGSLIGGTAVGFLVDRYEKRALILSPLLLFSSVIMFIVSFALTNDPWQYYVAMFLIGNCIGGPYNIIGTVIAIDIGNNIKEKGSITKVSSLIEGSAAFFTAISMIFIPRIPFEFIFYLFSAECIIATLALTPLFWKELRGVIQNSKKDPLLSEQAKL
jgi:MFS family permease